MNNRWSLKDVIVGKTLYWLLLSSLSTVGILAIAKRLVREERAMPSGMTHVVELNVTLPIIAIAFVIGSLFSAWIVRFLLNLRSSGPSQEEKTFRWYSIYSVGIAYGLLYVFLPMSDWIMAQEEQLSDSSVFIALFLTISAFIVPLALMLGTTLLIHTVLMRWTKTNEALLSEIERGAYNHRFNDETMQEDVIVALRRGHASTVSSAIVYVRVRRFLVATFRLIRDVLLIFFAFLFNVFNSIVSGGSSRGGGDSSSSYGDDDFALRQAEEEAERWQSDQAKKDAYYKATQLEKQAHHSRTQLEKQLHYNARYAHSERARYERDARAAKEARERADRM